MTGGLGWLLAAAEILLQGTGGKTETELWQGEAERLRSGIAYRISATARKSPGATGTILTCGLKGAFAFDGRLKADESPIDFLAYNPPGNPELSLVPTFGLYEVAGAVTVTDRRLERVEVRDAPFEGGALGVGETLVGNDYGCDVLLGGASGNYHRALFRTAGVQFKDDRWVFNGAGELVFRHRLAGRSWQSAKLQVGFLHFWKKGLAVAVSRNGRNWMTLAVLADGQTFGFRELPSELFPAEEIYVRFSASAEAALQLNRYVFMAVATGAPANAIGATAVGGATPAVTAHEYLREDYGRRLPMADARLQLWTASSGWKIPRRRALPAETAKAVRLALAANEAEAVQLVVTAPTALAGVRVTAGALRSAAGDELPASAVEVLRERYVEVTELVERGQVRGRYPDPLPPQRPEGVAIAAGEQQPFWVRVRTPKGTKKGIYRGELRVTAAGDVDCRVPFEVAVFGFELPDALACRTALGPFRQRSQVLKLHRGQTTDLRRLVDLYFDAMAAYHLTPYYPAELAHSWRCEWIDGRPQFDWSAWDAEMERAFARWPGFTSFRLHSELKLGTVALEGRRAEAMDEARLQAYLGEINRHLVEKGWAEKALVYAFDEPQPKDLDYVRSGLARAKRHAPQLPTLLTSPVKPELEPVVDLWCPIMKDFTPSTSNCWAYVCMYPHAPYATLFIEHPSVELRVWLWQCWMRGVRGVLVWDAINWSDGQGGLRNPYERTYDKPERGNGDGLFFYPPEAVYAAGEGFVDEPPVGSIRGEMLRDGLEDYEYLAQLRALAPTHPLLTVPPEVAAGLDSFSSSPVALEARRIALAKEIERLKK